MSRSRVPRVVIGREIVPTLPLNPTEGFVLSRIDGVLSEDDIGPATGLSDAVVKPAIERLRNLGAIRFDGESDPSEDSLRRIADAAAERMRPASKAEASGEPVDLEESHRLRILETYSRLSIVTHYELLGVDPSAEKKAIKKAYFELASIFHPDRFFRKRLGTYQEKMEAIFVKMTEAHDVLTSKQRADYDAQFPGAKNALAAQAPAQHRTQPLPANSPSHMHMAAVREPENPRASPPPAAGSRSPVPPPKTPHPSDPARRTVPQDARITAEGKPRTADGPRISVAPPAPSDKREAFARRMLGARSVPSSNPPPSSTPAAAAEGLRLRYGMMRSKADQVRAHQLAEAALAALARGDLISARRDLAAAMGLAPDDAVVKATAEKIGKR